MVGVNGYQNSVLTGWQRFFSAKADFRNNTAVSNSFWRVAMVAAAGILGTASHAEAATSIYWYDSEPGYYRQAPVGPQRRHKAKRHLAPKSESATKEAAK